MMNKQKYYISVVYHNVMRGLAIYCGLILGIIVILKLTGDRYVIVSILVLLEYVGIAFLLVYVFIKTIVALFIQINRILNIICYQASGTIHFPFIKHRVIFT